MKKQRKLSRFENREENDINLSGTATNNPTRIGCLRTLKILTP
jgi:hypothetical protein